jgi:orotidine-5'-phosphate decarboxylase
MVIPATPASQAPVAPATSGAQAATTATAVGSPGNAPAAEPAQQAADAKVTCRTVKTTGSRLQTRKVCSTPDSQKGSADWVREQQARGGIGASAIVNGQ